MDDMINKYATQYVNKPSPETEKAYRQAIESRTAFEKRNARSIQEEIRSGAVSEPIIRANHPDYRELKMNGSRTTMMTDPVVGKRVPG